MSKTEGFLILDSQNAAAGGGAEKVAGQYPQNMVRRKLADISNLQQKPKPSSVQDDKSKSIPITTKAYIEQLQQENMALMKMLAQRNKIIEQSGIELERLRSNLIKVQEQNQQLALSHTQMLGELNLGKDRLKALHHELGCKNGLLKARKLEEVNLIKLPGAIGGDDDKPRNTKRISQLQSSSSCEQLQSEENDGNKRPLARRQSARFLKSVESKSVEDLSERECPLPQEPLEENGSTSGSTSVKEDNILVKVDMIRSLEEEDTSTVSRDVKKPRNTKRRLRSQSLGPSESLQSEKNAGNRRLSVRRQSARFKAPELKPMEGEPVKDDIKIFEGALADEKPVLENGSVTNEDNRGSSGFKCKPPEIGRLSSSRPSRLAAQKVQSYKERPINVKMRRTK